MKENLPIIQVTPAATGASFPQKTVEGYRP
jgi:hypothetical protein